MPDTRVLLIAAMALVASQATSQTEPPSEETLVPRPEPDAGSPADGTPIGGVGRLACAQVVGMGNFAYLGQAADWALGYMAGRQDAGQTVQDEAALSPADSIDLVTGIAARCAETPEAPVIDAVRAIAEKVYGTSAEGGTVIAEAPPPPPDLPEPEVPRETSPPPARPDSTPANAAETEGG